MFEQSLEKNIDVFNLDKSKYSTVTFRKNIVNFHAIYRTINVYMSNKRQATAKTKNRSEVRGGGKKPWKQKGTGRARSGSIRSPLWVGGGIVFGPRGNQNFKLKQNRKEYFLAFCSSLTLKINNFVVLNYDFKNINKTKNFDKILKTFGIDSELNKILIIVEKLEDISKSTKLSAKNFNKIKLVDVNCINVYDIINAKYLIFTLKAFEFINKLINNRINHK